MLINNWISKVVQLITTTDLQGCGTLRKISTEQVWRVSRESSTKVMFKKKIILSFKIFPRFWLAKSTRLIHHNQLLMIKFGRILCLMRKWRQKCSLLQVNAPLTEKTWGWDWIVFLVKTKMADTSLVSRVRTTAGTRRNNG